VRNDVRGWMYALLPLLALPFFGATTLYRLQAGLRRPYMRALETRLHHIGSISVDGLAVPFQPRPEPRWWPPWSINWIAGLAGLTVYLSLYLLYLAVTFASEWYATGAPRHPIPTWAGVLLGIAYFSIATVLGWASYRSWLESGRLVREESQRRTRH
jgi:hypothetical protein